MPLGDLRRVVLKALLRIRGLGTCQERGVRLLSGDEIPVHSLNLNSTPSYPFIPLLCLCLTSFWSPFIWPSVHRFLCKGGSWAPNGSGKIMVDHVTPWPWLCMKTPQSARFCLIVPDFVAWRCVKVPDSTWKCLLHPKTNYQSWFLTSHSKLQKTWAFPQKDALFCRKMRFPAEKCNSPQKNAVFEGHNAGNCMRVSGHENQQRQSTFTRLILLDANGGRKWPDS